MALTRRATVKPADPEAEPRVKLTEPSVAEIAVEQEDPKPAPKKRCLLPRCVHTPEWRGLCAAHRQTHRGLAGPKEPKP